MTREEVLADLCYYDLRNPDCTYTQEEIDEMREIWERKAKQRKQEYHCSCDNCFYGRTKLAEYILTLLNK